MKPSSAYKASFYLTDSDTFQPPRSRQNAPQTTAPVIEGNTAGPIKVTIESNDGKTIYA